jgi:hypothetical protein
MIVALFGVPRVSTEQQLSIIFLCTVCRGGTIIHARFEVLMTVWMKSQVFWNVMPHQAVNSSWLPVSTASYNRELEFLLITNLMHFFVYLVIHFISLHVSSIKCSSSGDRIVLIHHLVRLVCVSDCLVCWCGRTGIPSSHLHRLIIPDDVLIQFGLLMLSTWCSKHVERWNE